MNDRVVLGLLIVALVEAGALALRRGVVDTPLAMGAPVATVGDPITVEDLARGCLALEQGKLPGVAPLSASERAAVKVHLAEAARHRDALLKVENDLATEEASLAGQARIIAASLSPEQRAWIVAQRNQVSVGSVEAAYWDTLLGELGP